MRETIGLALVLLGCSSVEQFPHPACLYDEAHFYRAGKVIARRDDGARLFRFNDAAQGDHGYLWIAEGDDRHTISVCKEATLMDREPH